MNKLNIAFYTDSFLPAVDGVVTSVRNTASELEKRGHNVYIFAASNMSREAIAKEGFNAKHVFPIHGIKFRRYPQYSIPMYPNFAQLKLLPETDIVHVQTPLFMGLSALVSAKGNRIPIVGTFHTLLNDDRALKTYISSKTIEKLAKKYSWSYLKFFYNSCNAVIAPSKPIKELLEGKGITNVHEVANGIDMKRFNKKVSGKKVREELLGKKIIVVFNLEPKKIGKFTSEGMLLAAEHEGRIALVVPDRDIEEGSEVF